MSKNEKSKWIISIILTSCLAVSGWLFGSLRSVDAQTHGQLYDRVNASDEMTKKFVIQFNADIVEIKTDLKYIKDYLKSIGAN